MSHTSEIQSAHSADIARYKVDDTCSTYNGILIHLPITREEIASYVGVTRKIISRKFRKFEGLGLITLSGNKQMIDQN